MDTDQHESAFDDAMSGAYRAMTRALFDPDVRVQERSRATYSAMIDCGFAFANCGEGRVGILNVPPWFFNDLTIWQALHAIEDTFCGIVLRILADDGNGVDPRAAALWQAERRTLREMLQEEFDRCPEASRHTYLESFQLLDVLRIQPIRTIRHVLG